jgi:hypothetical protein
VELGAGIGIPLGAGVGAALVTGAATGSAGGALLGALVAAVLVATGRPGVPSTDGRAPSDGDAQPAGTGDRSTADRPSGSVDE